VPVLREWLRTAPERKSRWACVNGLLLGAGSETASRDDLGIWAFSMVEFSELGGFGEVER
jgi:hypothetical protein